MLCARLLNDYFRLALSDIWHEDARSSIVLDTGSVYGISLINKLYRYLVFK